MAENPTKIIIALDGHSSCGKSTLAKDLAKALSYSYIDSGAMYRAVTLYFIQHNIDLEDAAAIEKALNDIHIRFENKAGKNRTILNGEDVEEEIRQMAVSNLVSPVAAVSAVRRAMVQQQQAMGKEKGLVMDGRDIGTVVFPDAALKIFLTASLEERTMRRYLELIERGQETTIEKVRKNLQERDYIDSNRADSPLRKAEDAIIIDNTSMDAKTTLEKVLELVNNHSLLKRE